MTTKKIKIANMMMEASKNDADIQDIGQKNINGQWVHEFSINGVVFQIIELTQNFDYEGTD